MCEYFTYSEMLSLEWIVLKILNTFILMCFPPHPKGSVLVIHEELGGGGVWLNSRALALHADGPEFNPHPPLFKRIR